MNEIAQGRTLLRRYPRSLIVDAAYYMIIAITNFYIYLPCMKAYFRDDDIVWITGPFYKIAPLAHIISTTLFMIVKDKVVYFHILSFALHLACCLVLFLLCRRIGVSSFLSFYFVLLYSTFYLSLEAVAYLATYYGLLAMLFCWWAIFLLAGYLFSETRSEFKRRFWRINILVFCSFASKEIALIMPLIVLSMLFIFWDLLKDKRLMLFLNALIPSAAWAVMLLVGIGDFRRGDLFSILANNKLLDIISLPLSAVNESFRAFFPVNMLYNHLIQLIRRIGDISPFVAFPAIMGGFVLFLTLKRLIKMLHGRDLDAESNSYTSGKTKVRVALLKPRMILWGVFILITMSVPIVGFFPLDVISGHVLYPILISWAFLLSIISSVISGWLHGFKINRWLVFVLLALLILILYINISEIEDLKQKHLEICKSWKLLLEGVLYNIVPSLEPQQHVTVILKARYFTVGENPDKIYSWLTALSDRVLPLERLHFMDKNLLKWTACRSRDPLLYYMDKDLVSIPYKQHADDNQSLVAWGEDDLMIYHERLSDNQILYEYYTDVYVIFQEPHCLVLVHRRDNWWDLGMGDGSPGNLNINLLHEIYQNCK